MDFIILEIESGGKPVAAITYIPIMRKENGIFKTRDFFILCRANPVTIINEIVSGLINFTICNCIEQHKYI